MVSQASCCFDRNCHSNHVVVRDNYGPADGDSEEIEQAIPDWELLNESEKEEQISENHRKLGNVKKKRMSPLILEDMLGVDRDLMLVKIEENCDRKIAKGK